MIVYRFYRRHRVRPGAGFKMLSAYKVVAGPIIDLVYSERLGKRRAWIATWS